MTKNVALHCQVVDDKISQNMCEPHSAAFFPETHVSQASCVNGTVVNHAITVFCSHLINFISCINHDSLTFIVELMGWSCGLGDSSRGDKCCYLLRARINKACVQKDRGRVEKKEKKKLDTEHESPKEVAVLQQMSASANQWVQNGGWFICTMSSICHFLNVTLVCPVSVFFQFFSHVHCWLWKFRNVLLE